MELQTFIDELNNLASKKSSDFSKLEGFISEFYSTKPLPITSLNSHFLIRASKNSPGEVFKNIKRCSYNPNVEGIPLQRCNYPEQQVFYASVPSDSPEISNVAAPILEVMLNDVKDENVNRVYFTMSRWQLNRKLNVIFLPMTETFTGKNLLLDSAKNNFKSLLDISFSADYNDAKKYFLESYLYISQCMGSFNNREINYKITASFTNAIFKLLAKENHHIDGMIYPSANTLGAGTNAVLKKEIIDDKVLVCDNVVMYAMLRNPSNPKDIHYPQVSNVVVPDEMGDFSFSYIR